MLTEKQLIKKCRRFNVAAQRELYERYAVGFKCLCVRYVKQSADADDVLQEAFLKIFQNIKQFKGEGSFEGWMKRIVINTALYHYKKTLRVKSHLSVDDVSEPSGTDFDDYEKSGSIDRTDIDENIFDYKLVEQADFSKKELLECVDKLKDDFKIVFNLYFIENYKHQQIAEVLGIDEKTSRSRLSRARKYIQELLYKKTIEKVSV